MLNRIPNNIHLFWAGDTLPDYAIQNIISFIENVPDGGRVFLWLSHPNCLHNAKPFQNLDNLPDTFVVKDINSLLQSDVFKNLRKQFPHTKPNLFLQVKLFIEKELIGLGNPAAAKDAVVPVILYEYGGYYFDLDACATKKISPPKESKYGVFVVNNGKTPNVLAAEPGHPFLVLALESLIEYCQNLPDTLKLQKISELDQNKFEHFSPTFFNLQILRNRKDQLRNVLTCMVSGSMITAAFAKYAHSIGSTVNADYIKDMNLQKLNMNAIDMGVEFDRMPRPIVTKTVAKPKSRNWFSFLPNLKHFFSKDKIIQKTSEEDELIKDKKVSNWRDDKQFKSFEAEDLNFARKSSKY